MLRDAQGRVAPDGENIPSRRTGVSLMAELFAKLTGPERQDPASRFLRVWESGAACWGRGA